MERDQHIHEQAHSSRRHRDIALWLGPVVALCLLFLPPPEGLDILAWRTAAIGLWMAVWWAGEAVPVAITALLPIILFPLFGISSVAAAAAPYANPLIYLFLGGFLIALAVQRWNLHKRVALFILSHTGGRPRHLIAGFMATSAFLSMWISNTATTIMMLPIALSVVPLVQRKQKGVDSADTSFAVALMLGVAYAASIGGIATLVGTPPNALLAGFMAQTYEIEIGFAQWMLIGLPVALCMLPLTWASLVLFRFKIDNSLPDGVADVIAEQAAAQGPLTKQEKRVGLVFLGVAALWIFRPFISATFSLPGLSDAGIALAGAAAMFIVPADWSRRDFLLNWEWASKAPFDVLILFGGGLSLAHAINSTGLAAWMGAGLGLLGAAPTVILILGAVALVIFLTELTSNTATTAAFLPVLSAIAVAIGLAPMALAAPAAIAASCAFMLPVATPPNAIVFGSGHVTIPQMVRAGFWLNIGGIIMVTILGTFLLPLIF